MSETQNLTLGETLQLAINHQQQGSLAQAEELYLRILQAFPEQLDALNLLGLLYSDQKRYALAEDLLQKASRINSMVPEIHNNLGVVFEEQKKLAIAET
ncbi:MAG: tetratricopeptide repeat protein, partial [Sulfuricellaceae bacterium]|nr:tetratricopeptide repeat protein [Sulfuricellaceae bacterium]